jgi:putative ABC transport system substrate-binding protein
MNRNSGDIHANLRRRVESTVARRSTLRALLVAGGAWLFPSLMVAAQSRAVPTLGMIWAGSGARTRIRRQSLKQALHELGYVEGRNIVMEERYAEGELARFSEIAVELVHLKVNIFVVTSVRAARAAQQATRGIPIVLVGGGDPVGTGLAANLARPGGNVTGLTALSPQLSAKRLELLKETLPHLKQVAVLWNPEGPAPKLAYKEIQVAAKDLLLQLRSFEVNSLDAINVAFVAMLRERVGALLTITDPFTGFHARQIVELAARSRLPAMYPSTSYVEAGGLMAYSVNVIDMYRRAAHYVDRLLKGEKPGDLPIEQPTKFELVINLKTAKALGITIPQSILVRADRVIE